MSRSSMTRFVLAVAFALAIPPISEAATFTVTNTNDSGAGSLRQALIDANAAAGSPHTIVFGTAFPALGTITLASALPTWNNGRLTVDGEVNTRLPRISGNDLHSIFVVGTTATRLDLRGLAIRNGLRSSGGCVALQVDGTPAILSVDNTLFSNCRAVANGFPAGGAIRWRSDSSSRVEIFDSVFSDNRTVAGVAPPIIAGGSGGAIAIEAGLISIQGNRFESNFIDVSGQSTGGSGGAIAATVATGGAAIALVTDNVFRANSATPTATDNFGLGGAAFIGCNGACTWTFERNYFRGNSARDGGAIWGPGSFGGSAAAKRVRVVNSSFFNNDVVGTGGALNLRSGRIELEYNSFFNNGAAAGAHVAILDSESVRVIHNVLAATFAGAAPCVAANVDVDAAFGSISRVPCNLGALIPVATVAQLPNPVIDESQAIGVLRFDGVPEVVDAVPAADNTTCPGEDARNQSRPIDGDSDGVARCDRGAFEHPSELLLRSGFES
jgi:hypothetical protein